MASNIAILITAYFHIVLRMSIFITQEAPLFKEVPSLASWIFLLGFLDIIWHTSFCCIQCVYFPKSASYIIETLGTIFLSEFALLIVWTTLENICSAITVWFLIKLHCYPSAFTPFMLGLTTTSLSVGCVLSLAIAVDRIYFLRKRGRLLLRRLRDLYQKLRNRQMINKEQNFNNETHITKENFVNKRGRHGNCPRCKQKKYNTTPC